MRTYHQKARSSDDGALRYCISYPKKMMKSALNLVKSEYKKLPDGNGIKLFSVVILLLFFGTPWGFLVSSGQNAKALQIADAQTATTIAAETIPRLVIPSPLTVVANAIVDVPISFLGDGENEINAITFALRYDPNLLSLDAVDNINFTLPDGFTGSVFPDELTANQLDFAIYSLSRNGLTDGQLATLPFKATCPAGFPNDIVTEIQFSGIPPLTYGDINGRAVVGDFENGTIRIVCQPTPTPMPSSTFTPTSTPTITPTTILTATPPLTSTITPTVSPTSTQRPNGTQPPMPTTTATGSPSITVTATAIPESTAPGGPTTQPPSTQLPSTPGPESTPPIDMTSTPLTPTSTTDPKGENNGDDNSGSNPDGDNDAVDFMAQATTEENESLNINFPPANFPPPDFTWASGNVTLVDTTLPSHGTVLANVDGSLLYIPDNGYSGEDSFIYTLSDANGVEADILVTISIDAFKNAPIILNVIDSKTSQVGETVSLLLEATDIDTPNDELDYSALGLPPGLTINRESGIIYGTIEQNAAQSYFVTLLAFDGTSFGVLDFYWYIEGGTSKLSTVQTQLYLPIVIP